jgi:hypothetical protein
MGQDPDYTKLLSCWGRIACWRIVMLANFYVGESSCWQNVMLAKYYVGELSVVECKLSNCHDTSEK